MQNETLGDADSQHVPVLLAEVLEGLNIKADGVYLDCTGGYGGHSVEILNRLSPKGKLVICDYHRETAERLQKKFADHANVTVLWARFSEIFEKTALKFDGIMADFGISSPQLEDVTLGIGFQVDEAPLDMRIDASLTMTAADILEEWTETELADLFFYQGGETGSRKLARAIVSDRNEGKYYRTAGELRDLCARVLGRFYRSRKIHAATKVFQALRIAVNRELQEIEGLLATAPLQLNSEGRLVLISFHSGEDRLVKTRFRELNDTEEFKLVVRKAIMPSEDEVKMNARSRSAKLRVLQKLK